MISIWKRNIIPFWDEPTAESHDRGPSVGRKWQFTSGAATLATLVVCTVRVRMLAIALACSASSLNNNWKYVELVLLRLHFFGGADWLGISSARAFSFSDGHSLDSQDSDTLRSAWHSRCCVSLISGGIPQLEHRTGGELSNKLHFSAALNFKWVLPSCNIL